MAKGGTWKPWVLAIQFKEFLSMPQPPHHPRFRRTTAVLLQKRGEVVPHAHHTTYQQRLQCKRMPSSCIIAAAAIGHYWLNLLPMHSCSCDVATSILLILHIINTISLSLGRVVAILLRGGDGRCAKLRHSTLAKDCQRYLNIKYETSSIQLSKFRSWCLTLWRLVQYFCKFHSTCQYQTRRTARRNITVDSRRA